MIEVPELFLAAACTSLQEARQADVPETDRLWFTPGFLALRFLCDLLTGSPIVPGDADLISGPFVYLDGPPNPNSDEGIQLFRVMEGAAKRLSELQPKSVAATAADLLRELQRYDQAADELPALTAAIAQLANLARRGQDSGKSLFVKVLFR